MACDLCGNNHVTRKCPMLSLPDQKTNCEALDNDANLAYKSLPSWVQVSQRPDGITSVIAHQRLPKCTRLGPLIAPQMPNPVSNNFFPLKLCHSSGGETYFDLSRKQLCNWLSLIPQGSATDRNLLACQIDDLLYYVTAEDVIERTELRVWYAPFYYERIIDDLKALRNNQNLKGTDIINQGVSSNCKAVSESEFRASSSLSRIAVGKGLVTFTHNVCGSESDNHMLQHSTSSEVNDISDNTLDGYIHAAGISCRYVHKEQVLEKQNEYRKSTDTDCISSDGNVTVPPTIEIVNGKRNPRDPEKIVTFTISATVRSQLSSLFVNGSPTSDHPHIEHSISEDVFCDDFSDEEERQTSISSNRNTRKPYKLQKPKSEVFVADSDVVNQLPARALGAWHTHPWCCRYCGDNFTKLLPFANHVKAHLRWIIGRCFQCGECSRSFSSSQLLQRHKVVSHKSCEILASLASSENRGESEVSVKHEILSDEEPLDDIGTNENKQSLKKLPSLPTNFIKGPHDCQICPKQFHKAEYLLRHLRKHTGDFTCQKCLKVFARKESLQKHTCPDGLQHESLECSLCSRSFFSTILLQQHYLKHKGSRKCTRCGRFFSNVGSLEKHMKNCPSVEISTSFQCGICCKEFVNQSLLDRHMSSHSRQYQCEICNKTYMSSTSLQHHLPLCRQIQQVVNFGHVKCEDCGKVSTETAEFRTHYQKHTHPFHCTGCSHRFRTRVGYEVHVCEVELQCDQCGVEFRSVQALNRHSAVHGPPPFTCLTCRRSYYRKESLDRHACSFETEAKEAVQPKVNSNFTCNICGAILATRHSYTTHIKTAHGGSAAKEFSCEVCGKQFYRKDLLREHSAVHAPPSYPCPHCKKLFKTRKSLEVHSMLHLGIKRFACKYCNKKYHQKVNLARHERSHMPRGAVKCQYCGCQCLSTDDLKAHLLSHTVVQPDLAQKPQRDQGDVLADKETAQGYNCSEELESSEQKFKSKVFPCNDAKPQLKVLCKSVDGIHTEQKIFSGPNSVINAEKTLQTSPSKRIHLDINPEVKGTQSLSSGFRTDQHVLSITKDTAIKENSISQTEMEKNSTTVFIPERISNVCLLSSNEQPLKNDSNYSKELQKCSRTLQNIPDNFQAEPSSVNASVCDMNNTDHHHSDPSTSFVSDVTHTYHLNLDENCQVTVEKRNDHFDQYSYRHINSESCNEGDLSLKCSSSSLEEQVSIYNSNSSGMSITPSVAKPLKCHVLSDDQLHGSVVLMSDAAEDNNH